MLKAILGAGLALAICASPTLADSGWTISLGGAHVVPQEADLKTATTGVEIDFSSGWGVVGAAGYDFDPIRAELELSYRFFDVDSITESSSSGLETQTTNGDVGIAAAFINGYFDLKLIDWVTPYVGAGVGAAHISANDVSIPGRTGTLDDSDIAPGGQLMFGASVPIADGLDVAAGYRVMLLGDVTGAVSGGSAAGDKEVTHILIHNAELALRYRF